MAGGTDNAGVLTDAAAYDPAEREWRVATDALPPGLAAPHARATGLDDRLFVWAAGAEPGGSPVIWRYDPGVDRWDETESPAPSPDVGTNQWLTAIDDALVLVSSQGPGGRPRLVIGEEDGWREVAGPAGSRGPPGDLANPYSEAAVADGDRVYVFHDSAEPLRYDVPDEAWTALPALEAAATTTTRTLPQHWEAVPADDHVLVWLGGVDEADATAEASPAGVVVWQPGD